MTEHDEALRCFEWLHDYCNRHFTEDENGKTRGCPTCIFGKRSIVKGLPYYECRLNGMATYDIGYQELLRDTKKRKAEIEQESE